MNLRRLDGFAEPFKVVPFKNGDDPTEDPVSVFCSYDKHTNM